MTRRGMSNGRATLFWSCAKACKKCSWSRNFEPVKGWEAEPTTLQQPPYRVVQSYRVIKCPEYECDLPEKYKNDGCYTKEVQNDAG